MEFIALEQLIIAPNRQREQFDPKHIEDLGRSIEGLGLMHAPVVRDDMRTLVAGECRVKAITLLHEHDRKFHYGGSVVPKGMIPVIPVGQLSPEALEEAELDENIKRKDLTWKERANAIARLHNLRCVQASNRNETHTLKDTATELKGAEAKGSEITEIREAQLLQSFENDPEVAKAKSRPEALNIAKKKLLAEFTAKLAEQYTESNNGECPHTLFMDSCLTVLPGMESGLVDVIITDPPYGIDAHKMAPLSGSVAGTQHEYSDDFPSAFRIWDCILKEGARIGKQHCALYMFCDFQHYGTLATLAATHGWIVWDRPIIWHKPGGGMLGDIQHGPRRSYETILFAYRGDKRTMGAFNDVVIMNGGDSILHAAAKPPALYAELLRRSTVPGMVVLDPCAGSGPVFVASNMLNLTAIGIEVSQQHAATALSRINAKE